MPVDDVFFKNTNLAQFIWYQEQMNIDSKEEFETKRYFEEYNAMFVNSEGVRKVREARENTINVPNEYFEETIKELFGKELPKNMSEENIKEFLEKEQKNEKIDQYLDMQLDEVKFIPFDGD